MTVIKYFMVNELIVVKDTKPGKIKAGKKMSNSGF